MQLKMLQSLTGIKYQYDIAQDNFVIGSVTLNDNVTGHGSIEINFKNRRRCPQIRCIRACKVPYQKRPLDRRDAPFSVEINGQVCGTM